MSFGKFFNVTGAYIHVNICTDEVRVMKIRHQRLQPDSSKIMAAVNVVYQKL